MRPLTIRFVAVLALLTGASLAFAFSSGPPASRTGAPAVGGVAAEPACTACHTTFPLNVAGATLEVLDVPQFYLPDSVYTLRVRMSSTFTPPRRWGFQLTAVRAADGQGVGTFDVTGLAGLQVVLGGGTFASRRYVEHNSAGTFAGDNGPVEWSLRWRAPASDLGTIRFYAAGNAANNNGASSGDHIYTASAETNIHPLLDVGPLAGREGGLAAHPNPFRGRTTISYALPRAGDADVAVFDAQGRRVRTLVSGERPAGPTSVVWDGARDDGSAAGPGVYFVRLASPGADPGIARRITRVR